MGPSHNILIVDDRPENLFALEKVLSQTGAGIVEASSGNDALLETLHHRFAMAILDVQMPGMDGYELAELLRGNEATRELPIIFLTAAYSDEQHVFKGYEAGGVDFITKPYNSKLLLSKVKVYLELDRQRIEKALHLERMRELIRLSTSVLAETSMERVLQRIADAARKLTETRLGASKYGCTKEGSFLIRAISSAEDVPALRLCEQFCSLRDGGIYLELIEKGKTVRLTDQELQSLSMRWGREGEDLQLRGFLGVALLGRNGRPNGFIMVSDKETGLDFTDEDEALLEQLASLASLGLQHIEARESSDKRAAEAEEGRKTLSQAQEALRRAYDELEIRVEERTSQLKAANEALQVEMVQRERADDEIKLTLKKLEESNRALQDFASIASHDLQEPLRKIIAFGDQLKRKYNPVLDETGRDYLERMQNAAKRMQGLILALLTYSRITARGEAFLPVDLSRLIGEVIEDLELRIEQTGARIEAAALPVIEADPNQMQQLFQNLIGNALKYHGPEKPVIRVRAERKDGKDWNLFFEDNGIGFDEKHVERIFAPFQRLHGRGQFEGAGMGLAICKRIVERHGGTITATSKPGEGSTFIVSLREEQE